ncbi:MAG TPA: glycosyltransferase family 2 protein [Candidatus Omnitrophica bacterium]|nr:MAG: hypothetical protein DRP61_04575 [Candidatus Omnitrophota bacterium]RKY42706.1 MAG: hypothetical protein DRP80_06500 [Candidatus Omnitrophota bacterium]HEC68797.1 glycosyltransferase family 2 protein [Candidatus Omnitrophota bacterium]
MKVWIVIPAFNEEKTIQVIVRKVKDKSLPVIVIDDGSQDNTYSKALEAEADIVLRNERNLGKGASLRKVFTYLINNNLDCEAVIIMDADAQHLPEELSLFIEKLKKGSCFIVGNRLSSPSGMPLIRLITNKLMSYIISKKIKQEVPDTQCGFKAIRREVLEKLCLKTSKYEIDSELIIKSAFLGYRIESVPIKSVYREQRSNINPFWDTFRFIRFILTV